jgi:uncharacterized protein involved in exopolysaccharide biosynthesis
VLLILIPVLMAALVVFMTRNPDFRFASETKLYTGITTGSSIEMDKTLNYFATSTAFDNLINVIKSRNTQQEVAIRLLAQHLLMQKPDPKFIGSKSFADLQKITPESVRTLVDKIGKTAGSHTQKEVPIVDSAEAQQTSLYDSNDVRRQFVLPASIDPFTYEMTVQALTDLMNSSDTNFVYALLNYSHPHYSIRSISSINVYRIGSSDLVQLKFESDDPGICQQTLKLMIDMCIGNYLIIKENQSDLVVRYFEQQLQLASERLKSAEEKLLEFNKANNIINYYEQSKAVAIVKEEHDVDYNNMRIKLAGLEASIANLQDKLGNQKQFRQKSRELLEKKDQLGDLAYKIATAETKSADKTVDVQKLTVLKQEEEKLKEQMRSQVADFNTLESTVEGLPVSSMLQDWIDHVIEAENTRAGLRVLEEQIKEFKKQYEIYAPAGANVKRIEREISVCEAEYLEILHELNQARLKLQDNELSANIKVVDPPYFPLSPNKTNRKMLVLMAAFAGFIIMLTIILILEYLDNSLKSPEKASKVLGIQMLGLLPKVSLLSRKMNMPNVMNRLLEMALQNGVRFMKGTSAEKPKTIVLFSTLRNEGKTMGGGNLAHKLKSKGEKVLFLHYAEDALQKSEKDFIGSNETPTAGSVSVQPQKRASILRKLLGYPDNRIDIESAFLKDPATYLDSDEYVAYELNEKYINAAHYTDLLPPEAVIPGNPGFVIVELPPVLIHPYPVSLVSNIELPVLVCRANREWTSADNTALDSLKELTGNKIRFFLNGVDMQAVESLLGEIPKPRSKFRVWIKRILGLQFHTGTQI